MDARPKILKSRLFPLKSVTEEQMQSALNKLASAGIVLVYEYDQRPYLQMLTWDRHQQIRSKKSKFPEPPRVFFCNHQIADVISYPQMRA